MGSFVPTTAEERAKMLAACGVSDIRELFADIPPEVLLTRPLDLPAGLSELEARRAVEALAAKNRVYASCFLGAGAYRHYIPSIVTEIVNKEEFVTAYTPYQAEISQGLLQSIFEYQTMICELTGMDAANASVYDGASAAAEAVAMCRERRRTKAYLSPLLPPDVLATVKTYCYAANAEWAMLDAEDGRTVLPAPGVLAEAACVLLGYPNYVGQLEDARAFAEAAHAEGAKLALYVNPVAQALLPSAGESGADVAVGEGQPLGMPLAFGGPYLGFMACAAPMTRKLPGRIVGETVDADGERAYVLTLQAREQHIRREKASSNVCSNAALCALTAAVYMAAMGPVGMREAAEQCAAKAHFLAARLAAIPGFGLRFGGEFFHEFVTECPEPALLRARLDEAGILGGLPYDGGILWCCTEMNTREEIDRLADICAAVGKEAAK